ncbi:putative NAD-dependent epimerase/dehydratase family protein [Natronospira proteinivora]|uniref:NAD-dependent epimerase/dehydratase family protein n=1 Tax=Natronospira proteinivora TaxID=1807133 RepID=A0ABT1G8R7_9GAMM|nr:DUF1611 domain-containing protein [Natronospira proteinivora]MCP1727697.1 putative NAD-dependent epimerase/dehydratase family protein [Natronospira proteinivora]
MREDAIVLANGAFQTANGKVAHGLVRGSERFRVQAVVDPDSAGQDAGILLDGEERGIPVVASVPEALDAADNPPTWCVLGVAPHGGRFNDELRQAALGALHSRLNLVNGLHDCANEDPQLAEAARENGVRIVDLRRPPPTHELHFWTGGIRRVTTPRVAVLGMDCAIGKRTTARILTRGLRERGQSAEMIYTGQTGWLQGGRFGFIFDATPNDYVSGELEHAIVRCHEEAAPDIMLLEGQSSLRNPSGPCGAEFLLSGAAQGVILQHDPHREYFDGLEAGGYALPSVADEIALIQHYGVPTLGVSLYGKPDDPVVAKAKATLEVSLGLPVVCPLGESVDPLLDTLMPLLKKA